MKHNWLNMACNNLNLHLQLNLAVVMTGPDIRSFSLSQSSLGNA